MKKRILSLIAIAVIFTSCWTDKEGATKALERSGFKKIEILGYDYFNESEDTYKTRFKAIALNGDEVTGTVTKGSFGKGSTIRLDD
jgi:hypothetical protein